jgi:hypothetical protein
LSPSGGLRADDRPPKPLGGGPRIIISHKRGFFRLGWDQSQISGHQPQTRANQTAKHGRRMIGPELNPPKSKG